MSHHMIAKVSAGRVNRDALDLACEACGLKPSRFIENYDVRGIKVSGFAVDLGWDKMVVYDDLPVLDQAGKPVFVGDQEQREVAVHFDNWSPGHGYHETTMLDRLKGAYDNALVGETERLVKEAREVATRMGATATIVEQAEDGLVVMEISMGDQ